MAFSDDFIYQLRLGNPIEDLFSSYVSLKRRGTTYTCLCPFHSEKTPSCTVYVDTQSFYCFGCGAGGDVITFVERIENLSYIESVKYLAQRAGIDIPDNSINDKSAHIKARTLEINRETANFYYKTLLSGAGAPGRAYFKSRCLSAATIKKYGLGYAPDNWNALHDHLIKSGFTEDEMIEACVCRKNSNGRIYDVFRNRVMFPIIDLRGNVIAFGGRILSGDSAKYINSSDTPVFKKSRNLFSLNFAKNSDSKRLILAEGYMDVITINQAGFENVVATLGTSLTSEQARIMSQYASEIVIAYDSDKAGVAATQRAINLLTAVGVSVKIINMSGAKDPDEYIKKFGSTKFRLLLEQSGDAVNFQLDKCKAEADISTEAGKVDYLRRAIGIIAELTDPIARDVYISRVSRDADINTNVLHIQLESTLKKRSLIQKKKEWKTIETSLNMPDTVNPDSVKYPKQNKAEEYIISYLMKNPDKLEHITSVISTDEFVTAFNKKVFSEVCKAIKESTVFSVSLLSEFFDSSQMGKICGIEAKNRDKTITEQTILDCVDVLKNFNAGFVYNNEVELSDDDLLKIQQQLKNKK
ncbi:MAG: DNA primase [Oscillospiraceae bacterium]|nr:DNA primase [Oscillospiraceae bacterium]